MIRADLKTYVHLLYTAAAPHEAELLCVGTGGQSIRIRFYRDSAAASISHPSSSGNHILHLPYRELSNIFAALSERKPVHLEFNPDQPDCVQLSTP